MSACIQYPPGPSASSRFLELADRYDRVVVMAHNNPDPDAIGSGWAISHLIRERLGKPASFIACGEIVRAENRKLISLLKPPLQLGGKMDGAGRSLLVLVDCDVHAANHPPIRPAAQPVAVIDHHYDATWTRDADILYEDLRPEVVATASIAASYLHEQGVLPPESLATALVYGIRTETRAGQNRYSGLDHAMLSWVTGLANSSFVSQIEDAPYNLTYYSDLALALQSTSLYDETVFCVLPQCQGPEVVGEVADLLVRCEIIRNVFCGAIYKGNLVCSVRTEDPRKNAARLVLSLLEGIGHGGGHTHRAGGIIERVGEDQSRWVRIIGTLRARWLELCGASEARRGRLVPRPSILALLEQDPDQ